MRKTGGKQSPNIYPSASPAVDIVDIVDIDPVVVRVLWVLGGLPFLPLNHHKGGNREKEGTLTSPGTHADLAKGELPLCRGVLRGVLAAPLPKSRKTCVPVSGVGGEYFVLSWLSMSRKPACCL